MVAAEIFPIRVDAYTFGFARLSLSQQFPQFFFVLLHNDLIFAGELTGQCRRDDVAEVEKLKFAPKGVFFVELTYSGKSFAGEFSILKTLGYMLKSL